MNSNETKALLTIGIPTYNRSDFFNLGIMK